MKAKLIFNLPDESVEFEQAVNGAKWPVAIWNFDQTLRKKYKYEDNETINIQEVRDLLRVELGEYNLSLE